MISTTKNKLLIDALHLPEGATKLCLEITDDELAITTLKFQGPVMLDAELFKNGDTIVLSGKINFRVVLECVNCLQTFEKDFSESIYQEYVKVLKPLPVVSAQLEEKDFIREYYTADYFDITGLIRDTIILAIPIAPWCQDDCPGVSV